MKSVDELKELHGETYVERFETQQSSRRLSRLIGRVDLTEDARVLDIGCGNGMLMDHIALKVKSYTGIDFSEPFIRSANKRKKDHKIENAEFYCSDVHDFCKNNQANFDVAFAMDIAEHIYDEEWLNILESIKKTLVSGGRLYLHTPNADFFLEIMKNKDFLVKQFPEHIAVRTRQHNEVLLLKAGFNEVITKFLPHYNILRYLHGLSFTPVIGKYFKARLFVEARN